MNYHTTNSVANKAMAWYNSFGLGETPGLLEIEAYLDGLVDGGAPLNMVNYVEEEIFTPKEKE